MFLVRLSGWTTVAAWLLAVIAQSPGTPPRSIQTPLEELNYHDEAARSAASARLIANGDQARPFVEAAEKQARSEGKTVYADRCRLVLERIEPFKEMAHYVVEKVEPADRWYKYPDPPWVISDEHSDRVAPDLILASFRGSRPGYEPYRFLAYDLRSRNVIEIHKWTDLLPYVKRAATEEELRETCTTLLKFLPLQICQCLQWSDFQLKSMVIEPVEGGRRIKMSLLESPPRRFPEEGRVTIEVSSDGVIKEMRQTFERHRHY